MPFFRKASRSSADKAKKQKDSNKKKKNKGGFLKKKKTPLINYEDASRASSTQPQPQWNKIETDFTGLRVTTKENVKAHPIISSKNIPGINVDGKLEQRKSLDKSWDAFDKNDQLLLHENQENTSFPKMQAIQEDGEMELPKQKSGEDEHVRKENESLGPIDMDKYTEHSSLDQQSFPDPQQKYVPRPSNDIDSFGSGSNNSDTGDSTSPHEKSIADDFTCELTYSHSASSEDNAEEMVPEDTKTEKPMGDKQRTLELEELVADISQDELQVFDDDSIPSVSAYVSLNRIPKSDLTLTLETTTTTLEPSRSDESSQRSEWKPKSNVTTPLGSSKQEIDALNRFLSVVGPDFNECKLSFGDRKEMYDAARKTGLNKVLVDKFLDQSAGITTVEEASAFSDLSPTSSYSTTSRSLAMSKSEFSDDTSTTGFSRDSEHSIRYKYLPRTSDSPHADRHYGCKGIFGEFFWNNPKKTRKDILKTGQGILESIGAVMAGEDGSFHGEA